MVPRGGGQRRILRGATFLPLADIEEEEWDDEGEEEDPRIAALEAALSEQQSALASQQSYIQRCAILPGALLHLAATHAITLRNLANSLQRHDDSCHSTSACYKKLTHDRHHRGAHVEQDQNSKYSHLYIPAPEHQQRHSQCWSYLQSVCPLQPIIAVCRGHLLVMI